MFPFKLSYDIVHTSLHVTTHLDNLSEEHTEDISKSFRTNLIFISSIRTELTIVSGSIVFRRKKNYVDFYRVRHEFHSDDVSHDSKLSQFYSMPNILKIEIFFAFTTLRSVYFCYVHYVNVDFTFL